MRSKAKARHTHIHAHLHRLFIGSVHLNACCRSQCEKGIKGNAKLKWEQEPYGRFVWFCCEHLLILVKLNVNYSKTDRMPHSSPAARFTLHVISKINAVQIQSAIPPETLTFSPKRADGFVALPSCIIERISVDLRTCCDVSSRLQPIDLIN